MQCSLPTVSPFSSSLPTMNSQPQSIDTNHSSMEPHRSKFTDPKFMSSVASSILRLPGSNRQTSQPGYAAPILATAGKATSTRFLSLCCPGTTGDNNTENPTSPRCVILLVVPYHRLIISLGSQSGGLRSHRARVDHGRRNFVCLNLISQVPRRQR